MLMLHFSCAKEMKSKNSASGRILCVVDVDNYSPRARH